MRHRPFINFFPIILPIHGLWLTILGLIFLIQQTLKLLNIRKDQLLNIFLSIAMHCFTSLLESWMSSCFIILLFSINQAAQQVSFVKNRLIRDEFIHLVFSISIRYLCQKFDNNQLFFSKKKLLTLSMITICISQKLEMVQDQHIFTRYYKMKPW